MFIRMYNWVKPIMSQKFESKIVTLLKSYDTCLLQAVARASLKFILFTVALKHICFV